MAACSEVVLRHGSAHGREGWLQRGPLPFCGHWTRFDQIGVAYQASRLTLLSRAGEVGQCEARASELVEPEASFRAPLARQARLRNRG